MRGPTGAMRLIGALRNLAHRLPGAADAAQALGRLQAAAAAPLQVQATASFGTLPGSASHWQQQQQHSQQQGPRLLKQQHLEQAQPTTTSSAPSERHFAAAAAAVPAWADATPQQQTPWQQQQQPLPLLQQQQHRHQRSSSLLAAPGQQQWQQLRQQLRRLPHWQQWQQQRGLLGVVQHKNYQDHNKKRSQKNKIKTPSIAKRRVVVGEDGVMWRMQAGRRHKRYKKSRERLRSLKGMVPLHHADAAKLRKLGYKRTWWFHLKA